tara:strand:+ start:457 stop:789 length:333 start_codon:yes stop_codon:yes gene_type:complete
MTPNQKILEDMNTENVSNTMTPFYAKKPPVREDILQNDKIAYRNAFKVLRDDAQNLIRRALQNPEAIRYEEAREAFEIAKFINGLEVERMKTQDLRLSTSAICSKFKTTI